MFSTEMLLAFAVTTGIFAFIPGPAMFYAAARTMAGGRKAGLMAAMGIHVGAYVHVFAAAAGLTMLFKAVPPAYLAVKFAGALYLVWLGISLIRKTDPNDEPVDLNVQRTGYKAFVQSILIEVLNPKTVIFFTAFLPQFIDVKTTVPVAAQLAILGTAVNLIFTFADVVSVLLASAVLSRLKRSGRAQGLVRKAGGTVLIGLGAHLAFQKA